jgi:8-oxo-dGTP pyrophosphatase MutT (NUDIX family)
VILLHGSPDADLKILEPRIYSPSEKPVICATPDWKMALVYARSWTNADFFLSAVGVNGKTKYCLEEKRRGAIQLLRGPGHIYAVPDPTPFEPVKPGSSEYTSQTPTPVVHLLEVPNVLQACHFFGVEIIPCGARKGRPEYIRVFATRNGYQGILLHHYEKARRWGPPAGRIGKGENALVAGARELRERTGWKGNPVDFRLLGSYAGEDGEIWHVVHVDFEDLVWVSIPQTEIRWSDGSSVAVAPGDTLEISDAIPAEGV